MKPVEQDSPRVRSALLDQYKRRAKGILHLGAHLGQEARDYAELNKPVVWVEALPHIHARLAKTIEQFPGQRALCALLGDRNGAQRIFHISNNSEGVSSSIFQFGGYGSGDNSLWPELGLAMVDSLTLPMFRLDTLLLGNDIDARQYDFWVVDLQGAGGFEPLWQPGQEHDDVLFVRADEMQRVTSEFHSDAYLRHNQRRLEHLASLRLPIPGKSVLEVGAGPGDHTSFYLDRGCRVLATELRPENLMLLRNRYRAHPRVEVAALDMDNPVPLGRKFDIVHCYGLLYHLQQPEQALRFLAEHCSGMLLLETCVSPGDEAAINPLAEPSEQFSQSFYGTGCRPTRIWVWNMLSALFPHVYAPRTQPAHEDVARVAATLPAALVIRDDHGFLMEDRDRGLRFSAAHG